MDGHSSRDPKHERQTNRVTGVAQKEARGAHNSEVTPIEAGLRYISSHRNGASRHWSNKPLTGMAQRERAGLITPRAQDQNLLPVFSIRSFTEAVTLSIQQHTAGVAQRKSA